jgi:hypothetical protein
MSAFIGFVLVVVAVVVIGVALVSRAIAARRRRDPPRRGGSQSDTAQSEDATGYVTGIWMLGGAESAAPKDQAHGQHPGADAAGAHATDPGVGRGGGRK